MKIETIRNRREKIFAQLFFDNGNWISQPRTFVFSDGTKYTPDFYDVDRDVYIEVVGTRQAYSLNKDKYAKMAKEFEAFGFECRRFTGELYITIPKNELRKRNPDHVDAWWEDMPEIEIPYPQSSAEAIRAICYLNAWTVRRLANEMGLADGSSLSAIIKERVTGTPEMTARILAHMPEKYKKHMGERP